MSTNEAMEKNKPHSTLFIRHLPARLQKKDQEELLKRFGAKQVKIFGKYGRLKHSAFAKFEDSSDADRALKRLHQLEILGKRLNVEYAKEDLNFDELGPPKCDALKESTPKDNNVEKSNYEPDVKAVSEKIDNICSTWSVNYSFNPKLKYSYPPPSVTILTNIANALGTVPKFYVQVLHLMNRFNLPAPFGAVTPTPPLPENIPPPIPAEPEITEVEMAVSTSEESELESSEDEKDLSKQLSASLVPLKRKLKPVKKLNMKKARLIPKSQGIVAKPSSSAGVKVDEVFEQQEGTVQKKIEIKQVTVPASNSEQLDNPIAIGVNKLLRGITQNPFDSLSTTSINDTVQSAPTDILSLTENTSEVKEEAAGFGKMEPVEKTEVEEEEPDEEWGAGDFISSRRLRRGRLSSREMRDLNVFRKYDPGEPSSRLYIKNIAKQTSEKDLHYIFGRYVDWENDHEKNMFDIRLMKEGRMKGQAFVTLSNSDKAKQALQDANAFELNGKPLVIQFARSAKPKEDSKDKTDKEKK